MPALTDRFDRALGGARELLGRPARAVEEAVGAEGARIARRLSSGPYTSAMLRAMGHPYSRRAPHPPAPPSIINVQSGLFARSWRIAARVRGLTLNVEIENTAPYARYLLRGTTRMIERPYERALREDLVRAIPHIVADALARTFRR